ncbi:C-C motif chemokine 4-like [Menidia menidia]|uniref:(Atlantic silverside) hypothetical protein n=1 Tax=Menidia menidia TaxID=238744 RepID=A0A8S4BJH8_9TELE|nr:unnamed protein product [Menidia menidia]
MKSVCVAVGLLLLSLQLCTSMPNGPNAMAPTLCCFKFFPARIPLTHIKAIVKTHSSCLKKAFVVTTPKRKICVSQAEKWAQQIYAEANM